MGAFFDRLGAVASIDYAGYVDVQVFDEAVGYIDECLTELGKARGTTGFTGGLQEAVVGWLDREAKKLGPVRDKIGVLAECFQGARQAMLTAMSEYNFMAHDLISAPEMRHYSNDGPVALSDGRILTGYQYLAQLQADRESEREQKCERVLNTMNKTVKHWERELARDSTDLGDDDGRTDAGSGTGSGGGGGSFPGLGGGGLPSLGGGGLLSLGGSSLPLFSGGSGSDTGSFVGSPDSVLGLRVNGFKRWSPDLIGPQSSDTQYLDPTFLNNGYQSPSYGDEPSYEYLSDTSGSGSSKARPPSYEAFGGSGGDGGNSAGSYDSGYAYPQETFDLGASSVAPPSYGDDGWDGYVPPSALNGDDPRWRDDYEIPEPTPVGGTSKPQVAIAGGMIIAGGAMAGAAGLAGATGAAGAAGAASGLPGMMLGPAGAGSAGAGGVGATGVAAGTTNAAGPTGAGAGGATGGTAAGARGGMMGAPGATGGGGAGGDKKKGRRKHLGRQSPDDDSDNASWEQLAGPGSAGTVAMNYPESDTWD